MIFSKGHNSGKEHIHEKKKKQHMGQLFFKTNPYRFKVYSAFNPKQTGLWQKHSKTYICDQTAIRNEHSTYYKYYKVHHDSSKQVKYKCYKGKCNKYLTVQQFSIYILNCLNCPCQVKLMIPRPLRILKQYRP